MSKPYTNEDARFDAEQLGRIPWEEKEEEVLLDDICDEVLVAELVARGYRVFNMNPGEQLELRKGKK